MHYDLSEVIFYTLSVFWKIFSFSVSEEIESILGLNYLLFWLLIDHYISFFFSEKWNSMTFVKKAACDDALSFRGKSKQMYHVMGVKWVRHPESQLKNPEKTLYTSFGFCIFFSPPFGK